MGEGPVGRPLSFKTANIRTEQFISGAVSLTDIRGQHISDSRDWWYDGMISRRITGFSVHGTGVAELVFMETRVNIMTGRQ